MKIKLILLLAIFFSPIILSAQELSSVNIFSEDAEKFILFLDGEQKNTEARAEVKARYLTKPRYEAKIVFANRDLPDITASIITVSPKGKKAEVTYKILKDKKGQHFLHLLVVVPIKDNGLSSDNESAYSGTEDADKAAFVDYTHVPVQKVVTTTTEDENGAKVTTTHLKTEYGQRDNNSANPAGCIPMDKWDFDKAKETIINSETEDKKLTAAKNIGVSNCFTSDQVTEILTLFYSEKTKLNFAKFAYAQTVDPNNYFKVNRVFESDDSRKELFDYINAHK